MQLNKEILFIIIHSAIQANINFETLHQCDFDF